MWNDIEFAQAKVEMVDYGRPNNELRPSMQIQVLL